MDLLSFSSPEQQLGSFAFRPPLTFSQSALCLCSLKASAKRSLKGISVETGIFEYPVRLYEGKEEAVTGEYGNDRERQAMEEDENKGRLAGPATPEDQYENSLSEAGLIPDAWQPLQIDLHKTKADKRKEWRRQELENARIKMMFEQQKRQKIRIVAEMEKEYGFGPVFPSSDEEKGQDNRSNDTFESGGQDIAQTPFSVVNLLLETEAEEKRIRAECRNQSDLEADLLFTADEKRWMKRAIPDPDRVHCSKWPALHVLVSSGQFLFLDRFLKLGVDVDAIDEDGYTPLQRAVMGKKETAVTQLVRAGADVHVCDKDGASVLHYSVRMGSLNMVRMFLKHGVEVNLPDKAGWTALHVAVMTGSSDLVRLLIVSGADKLLKTKDGQTPLQICLALGVGFNAYWIAKTLKRLPRIDPLAEETSIEDDNIV